MLSLPSAGFSRAVARSRPVLSALVGGAVMSALVLVPGVATTPSSGRLELASSGCPTAAHGVVRTAPGRGRTVALTFDDGPSRFTPQILTVLRRFGVRATFFQTGAHVDGHQALARQVAAEGHLVANHTYAHRYPSQVAGGWTRTYLADQLRRTNASVRAVAGRSPCFFRPPGGYLTTGLTSTAAGLGMSTVMWSVDTEDWKQPGRTTAGATARIVERARAGAFQSHPIVLMHDGKASREPEWQVSANRSNDVAALPAIIRYYQARGYRFVDLLGRSGLPPAPTTLRTTSAAKVRVPAGTRTIAVSGRLRFIGGDVASEPVEWLSRPVGRSGWTLRGVVRTDRQGVATVRDRPATATAYQLRYAGSRRLAAARADRVSTVEPYLIDTDLRVSAPASVMSGSDVVVEGRVTAAGRVRPGVPVEVSRSVEGASSASPVATLTTGTDGSFRLVDPRPVATTTYTVRVRQHVPYTVATRVVVVQVSSAESVEPSVSAGRLRTAGR